MFGCLVDSKFNMTAKVLSPLEATKDATGQWVNVQDDITGEIKRIWVADSDASDGVETARFINCMVRPVITNAGGGASEKYTKDGLQESLELINMKYPSKEILTDSDRITEIRNSNGVLLWAEEKPNGDPTTFKGTVFDVIGVSPIIDPFGEHVENMAFLKRAGVQGG